MKAGRETEGEKRFMRTFFWFGKRIGGILSTDLRSKLIQKYCIMDVPASYFHQEVGVSD